LSFSGSVLRRYSAWNDLFIGGKALSADPVTGQRSLLGGVKAQHKVVLGDALANLLGADGHPALFLVPFSWQQTTVG
jgi:hypothetical protein